MLDVLGRVLDGKKSLIQLILLLEWGEENKMINKIPNCLYGVYRIVEERAVNINCSLRQVGIVTTK